MLEVAITPGGALFMKQPVGLLVGGAGTNHTSALLWPAASPRGVRRCDVHSGWFTLA